jgi:hypothetical protein
MAYDHKTNDLAAMFARNLKEVVGSAPTQPKEDRPGVGRLSQLAQMKV